MAIQTYIIFKTSSGEIKNRTNLEESDFESFRGALVAGNPGVDMVQADFPVGWIWDGSIATAPPPNFTDEELREQLAADEADKILGEIQRRAMNLIFSLAKQNTPSLTLQQFLNAFEGTLGDEPITRQMFINYIRDNRV